MTSSRIVAIMLLAALPAGAQNLADLQPVEIIVERAGGQPPVVGDPVRILVRVTNHGPDVYDGTTPGKARRYYSLQGGRLGITIDIDEPSKPDPGLESSFTTMLSDSFAVNIAVNDTVTLDFGITSFAPNKAGIHGISALVTPGSGNIDPMPSNNILASFFLVAAVVPVLGWWALALLAGTLFLVTRSRLARRRAASGATQT